MSRQERAIATAGVILLLTFSAIVTARHEESLGEVRAMLHEDAEWRTYTTTDSDGNPVVRTDYDPEKWRVVVRLPDGHAHAVETKLDRWAELEKGDTVAVRTTRIWWGLPINRRLSEAAWGFPR